MHRLPVGPDDLEAPRRDPPSGGGPHEAVVVADVHHRVGPAVVGRGTGRGEMMRGAVGESPDPIGVGLEHLLAEHMVGGLVAMKALHRLQHRVDPLANGPSGVEPAVADEHIAQPFEVAEIDGDGVAGGELGERQAVVDGEGFVHGFTIACGSVLRTPAESAAAPPIGCAPTTMDSIRLDRSSPLPLWAQLENTLRRAIDAGEFDDRFPTDLELTRRFDVSRHTVREAVGRLQADGLLTRVRGRGTVVERPEFEQRLGALYSLFSSIEAAGVEQRSEVIAVGMVTDAAVAARLGLADDAELFRLERVRFADDEPLAIDTAWLPDDVGRPLLDADFTHTALYDEIEQQSQQRPDRGWERIAPVIPSAEEREILGCGTDEAAFRVERLGQHGDTTVEWRVTLIRGDRYRFFADWSVTGSGGLRMASGDGT